MSNEIYAVSELAAFHQFLGERLLEQGFTELTPDESVQEFRAYQRQREQLLAELGPALEQYRRGEGRELDIEQLIEQERQRLAEEGITD
jgi:hypothetical protein